MGIFTKARAKISPREARQIMRQPGRYVLLDVRMPEEYRESHIEGAKLIPVDELNRRAPAELPDKQAPILVYCRSGARAARAVQMLAQMGYANAVSFGGILDWPYETTRG